MEKEERDFVTFTDDNGHEFELDVIDYFEYEGEEYGVLTDLSEDCGDDCSTCEDECGHEHDVYIMKIVTNGDTEEFVPADENKLDELIKIVQERLGEDEEDGCDCGDENCDCEHDDCDCGHDHDDK